MGNKKGLAQLTRSFILEDFDTLGIQPHTMPNAIGMWYEEMHYMLYLLEGCDRDKNWVEIGAFCGGSACLMNLAKSQWENKGTGHIISVDLKFNPMFDLNISRLDHQEWHYKMEIDSSNFEKSYYDRFGFKYFESVDEPPQISFAFIDGFHGYEQIIVDFEQVQPYLTDDAIIAFHDASPYIYDEKWQQQRKEDGWHWTEGDEDFRVDEAILDIMEEYGYELLPRPKEFDAEHFAETKLTEWVRGKTSPFNAVAAIRKIDR